MLRRKAREEVLKSLYGSEFAEYGKAYYEDLLDGKSIEEQRSFIEETYEGRLDDQERVEELMSEFRSFVRELYEGTRENQERIDELISEFTVGWKVDRLAFLDRNILRMAIYEMLYYDDTPAEVVMNEAIELAKDYGTDNAPEFVNGILDRIWDEKSEKEKA